jgi:hypothetical protein
LAPARAPARYDTPRERLLAVFEGQGELFAQPGYRGCAFAAAAILLDAALARGMITGARPGTA